MDPLNQPVPPVASAPTTGAPELSQEEMKANLQDMMSKMSGSYQQFNSDKFTADNQTKDAQSKALVKFFDLLQGAGIDPSDMNAVQAFLESVKTSNPELSQQLEQAIQIILGSDQAAPDEGAIPPMGNIQSMITPGAESAPTGTASDSTLPALPQEVPSINASNANPQ